MRRLVPLVALMSVFAMISLGCGSEATPAVTTEPPTTIPRTPCDVNKAGFVATVSSGLDTIAVTKSPTRTSEQLTELPSLTQIQTFGSVFANPDGEMVIEVSTLDGICGYVDASEINGGDGKAFSRAPTPKRYIERVVHSLDAQALEADGLVDGGKSIRKNTELLMSTLVGAGTIDVRMDPSFGSDNGIPGCAASDRLVCRGEVWDTTNSRFLASTRVSYGENGVIKLVVSTTQDDTVKPTTTLVNEPARNAQTDAEVDLLYDVGTIFTIENRNDVTYLTLSRSGIVVESGDVLVGPEIKTKDVLTPESGSRLVDGVEVLRAYPVASTTPVSFVDPYWLAGNSGCGPFIPSNPTVGSFAADIAALQSGQLALLTFEGRVVTSIEIIEACQQ